MAAGSRPRAERMMLLSAAAWVATVTALVAAAVISLMWPGFSYGPWTFAAVVGALSAPIAFGLLRWPGAVKSGGSFLWGLLVALFGLGSATSSEGLFSPAMFVAGWAALAAAAASGLALYVERRASRPGAGNASEGPGLSR